ncbi:OLC1v1002794C1 [Oldenlandia corymbosa var. corymbosa]|uniref:OLC1v1002794C1 n=1 Tax=Oldenlandia corymbosa var. corymbosa TaxID=529605 RepID=A0AAV1DB04_OLDCO|nr:OLC1v1002794C1 [Oldenlandia corymbosa var. corymbosa]
MEVKGGKGSVKNPRYPKKPTVMNRAAGEASFQMVPTAAQLMLHRHIHSTPQPPPMSGGSQQQPPQKLKTVSEMKALVQKWFSERSKTRSCKTPLKSVPDILELSNC